jgi:hypothetical protein
VSGTNEDRVHALLEWSEDPGLLAHVRSAISGPRAVPFTSTTAICFDANIFLNIGKGAKAADLIDYIAAQHAGPLLASTQTLVELWNNHLRSVEALAGSLRSKFASLNDAIQEIDDSYVDLREGSGQLINAFEQEYGHVFSDNVQKDLGLVLELLQSTAYVGHVSRSRFTAVADSRKRLRIPPGFEDSGDGDFFVWADTLLALLDASDDGRAADGLVLVTEDKKKDWSLNGKAHPVLAAEMSKLASIPFSTVTLSDFKRLVKTQIES